MQWKTVIALLFTGSLILSIQLYSWHAQTGHWFLWSYTGERFDFSHPHIFDFLFSYRKGWLLYTPIMAIFIAGGLIYFFKKNKFRLVSFLLFISLVIFILSSWEGWWYGSSFGQRPIIDFYPHFALFFCIWFNATKSRWIKTPVLVLLALCLALNLIQTYQYDNHIITGDNMDKRKYCKVFLQTGNDYQWILDDPDKSASDYTFYDRSTVFNNYEIGLSGGKNITSIHPYSGRYASFACKEMPYGPAFTDTVSSLPQLPAGKTLSVSINMWMYFPYYNNTATMVVELREQGHPSSYFWAGLRLWPHEQRLNKWEESEMFLDLPAFKNKNDVLLIYLYNTADSVYIDDETIKFGVSK